MLECVINISEGQKRALLDELAKASGSSLLDLHTDPYHHRSVFTLAGDNVLADAIRLASAALELLDLNEHQGVHPRLGVIDVVPFVPLGNAGLMRPPDLKEALAARIDFADFVSGQLELPCFFYGPERSLPDIRKAAFHTLLPDRGPLVPHPTAGATCVGARGVLVAYNINTNGLNPLQTRKIAAALRSDTIRALGFDLEGQMQISCNLIDPVSMDIETLYDLVAALVQEAGGEVRDAELVGLIPEALLQPITRSRWPELALSQTMTIESRLSDSLAR